MKDFGQENYNWNQASLNLSQQGKGYVLITIVGVTGSTPRNSGTKMVVSQSEIFDTIGGGHLEFKAIKFAKQLLNSNKDCQQIEHFQLGSQLGQCCGGNASVLFECFAANVINIAVFGAGHVGQALIPILAALPCHITWLDSRAEQFPANTGHFANISTLVTDDPASEVVSMPANTLYIVMTHNHQLDFEISHAVLKREDFHYLGLIASDTKWRRFQQRYKHREVSQQLVQRMNCPIGLAQVSGKLPMEVAVSISGAIIESYQSLLVTNLVDSSVANSMGNEQTKALKNKGVPWQEIKQLLALQEPIQESAQALVQTSSRATVNEEGNK